MKLTKEQFAQAITDAVFSGLRKGAPSIPGSTPEFYALHMRALELAEAAIRENTPEVLRQLEQMGVEVHGLQ